MKQNQTTTLLFPSQERKEKSETRPRQVGLSSGGLCFGVVDIWPLLELALCLALCLSRLRFSCTGSGHLASGSGHSKWPDSGQASDIHNEETKPRRTPVCSKEQLAFQLSVGPHNQQDEHHMEPSLLSPKCYFPFKNDSDSQQKRHGLQHTGRGLALPPPLPLVTARLSQYQMWDNTASPPHHYPELRPGGKA